MARSEKQHSHRVWIDQCYYRITVMGSPTDILGGAANSNPDTFRIHHQRAAVSRCSAAAQPLHRDFLFSEMHTAHVIISNFMTSPRAQGNIDKKLVRCPARHSAGQLFSNARISVPARSPITNSFPGYYGTSQMRNIKQDPRSRGTHVLKIIHLFSSLGRLSMPNIYSGH